MIDAAVCIIENPQKQVLFLLRSSAPFGWGLPGGKVEPIDESYKAACIREVFEETGIKISEPEFLQECLSENGRKVMVFKALSKNSDVKLSKEHSAYLWTEFLTDKITLAGNTALFLGPYVWDSELTDLDYVFTFGKHQGYTVKDVIHHNPYYLDFLKKENIMRFKKKVWDYRNKVLNEAQDERDEAKRIESNRRADIAYRNNNLEKAVNTPYGKAVESSGGAYNVINDDGSYAGKTVFSQGFGSWSECGCDD